MKDLYTAMLLTLCIITFVSNIANATNISRQSTQLAEIEGKIMLHDGKATMTGGRTCIIGQEALVDTELTIQLATACAKAYQEQ
jgi:hypothetical protein